MRIPVSAGSRAKPTTSRTATAISPYGRPLFGLTSDRKERNQWKVYESAIARWPDVR